MYDFSLRNAAWGSAFRRVKGRRAEGRKAEAPELSVLLPFDRNRKGLNPLSTITPLQGLDLSALSMSQGCTRGYYNVSPSGLWACMIIPEVFTPLPIALFHSFLCSALTFSALPPFNLLPVLPFRLFCPSFAFASFFTNSESCQIRGSRAAAT
jgi:hypothetical protein